MIKFNNRYFNHPSPVGQLPLYYHLEASSLAQPGSVVYQPRDNIFTQQQINGLLDELSCENETPNEQF
jgi:hypothetical protein